MVDLAVVDVGVADLGESPSLLFALGVVDPCEFCPPAIGSKLIRYYTITSGI